MRKIKSLKITHFFDVIKKEVQSENDAEVLSMINESNDVKQEYIYKEELDISWDVGEHDYGAVKNTSNILSDPPYKVGYPRVVLERLPDNFVNNSVNKSLSTVQHENELEVPNGSDRKSFLQYYRRFCPDCHKTEPLDLKTHQCSNCKVPWYYECKKCTKKLSSYGGIISHLNTKCIEESNYYKCFKCNYKSIDKYKVNFHLKSVHSVVDSLDYIEKFESKNVQKDVMISANSQKCSKCGKQFQKLPPLLRHIQICGQTKSNAEDFAATVNAVQDKCLHHCVKCNQTVKHDKIGSFHQKKCRNCHSKFSFKCKKCDKICHSYAGMNRHLKLNHTVSNDVFKCPECDYETSFIEYLTKHVRQTHFLETHECPKCGQKCKNRNAFRNHLRYCKKEPTFQCDHCSYRGKSKENLKRHIFDVHTTGNEVDCPQCGVTLKNNGCLKVHISYCKIEPRHQCNSCSFKTKYKYDLKNHYESVHSNAQKTETCPKCAKECKNKSSLRSHVQRCEKMSELPCNYCDRLFKSKQTLTQHITRAHSKDNIDIVYNLQYLHCDDCSYKTKFKGDLVKHVITHLEINVKECPTCKKHFKSAEYFKKHAKLCGRDSLKCHLCKHQTFTKDCLKSHIINIHSEGNEIDCSKCG